MSLDLLTASQMLRVDIDQTGSACLIRTCGSRTVNSRFSLLQSFVYLLLCRYDGDTGVRSLKGLVWQLLQDMGSLCLPCVLKFFSFTANGGK